MLQCAPLLGFTVYVLCDFAFYSNTPRPVPYEHHNGRIMDAGQLLRHDGDYLPVSLCWILGRRFLPLEHSHPEAD